MTPLSNRQKAVLAQVARSAFFSQGIAGVSFDEWRRDEVERAVGLSGLRACGNDHYNTLLAHFEDLAGQSGRAFKALVRDQGEARRRLEWLIVQVMENSGLSPAYVATIARARFGAAVEDLNEAQLKQLLITIKSRASRKREQAERSSATKEGTWA